MSTTPLTSGRRSFAVTVLAVTLLAVVAACTPETDTTRTTSGCEAAVEAAADAIEVEDQVRHLDDALLQCRSLASLTGELARHPGLIGYSPETFAAIRCGRIEDEATLRAPTCASLTSPATTMPVTTIAEVVYVGESVDGRPIEIRPGQGVEFVGDVPAVIQQTVDIALESGCPGLLEQRDLWFARITTSRSGDLASVYARHAQNVADYIGCDLPPLDE